MPDRLETLHRQIEALTDPDGDFAVVCPLSGKRPVPVRGASFPTATAAEDAVGLVCEYRRLLREVDPYLENIPIVAAAEPADTLALTRESDDRRVSLSGRGGDADGDGDSDADGEWLVADESLLVHIQRDGQPLDDDSVSRQLRSKL